MSRAAVTTGASGSMTRAGEVISAPALSPRKLAVAAAGGATDAGAQRGTVVVAVVVLLELLLGQQIGFGDDADDVIVVVQDRYAADALVNEQLGDDVEGGVLVDGGDVGGHDVCDDAGHGALLRCLTRTMPGTVRASTSAILLACSCGGPLNSAIPSRTVTSQLGPKGWCVRSASMTALHRSSSMRASIAIRSPRLTMPTIRSR
ncbi:hypothetical protein BKM31_18555 [[Actinomadura] parvosata subsp. kistnae]|uniref:Uncharacterized protein n=1 Tax=[Actinomadura] parvosata subsp. kistnae TaxID=1909395 RepID=A0A1U9ZZ13_9ACTN|nr:hypothetical protein BKM31_18555 [Nonomuraea sp. ATCC 55076]